MRDGLVDGEHGVVHVCEQEVDAVDGRLEELPALVDLVEEVVRVADVDVEESLEQQAVLLRVLVEPRH